MMETQIAKTEIIPSNIEVIGTSAIESIERVQIDVQISTAHKYPRSLAKFKSTATAMACIDVETAESCLYSRPVGGGKMAEGMSVRLAEIVGACYGNLRVAARIIQQDPNKVTVQAVAHDLESNFMTSIERVETTLKKDGTPYDERMRNVVTLAALAKARRDATFVVVPRALAKPIEYAVKSLLNGDEKSISERRERVKSWVRTLKIDPLRVWAAFEAKGVEDLTAENLDTLTGLRTSIKDGDTTIDEAFPKIGEKKSIFSEQSKTAETVETKGTAEVSSDVTDTLSLQDGKPF